MKLLFLETITLTDTKTQLYSFVLNMHVSKHTYIQYMCTHTYTHTYTHTHTYTCMHAYTHTHTHTRTHTHTHTHTHTQHSLVLPGQLVQRQ